MLFTEVKIDPSKLLLATEVMPVEISCTVLFFFTGLIESETIRLLGRME
jgi:hypothetical protein